jgi:hypothetical protein
MKASLLTVPVELRLQIYSVCFGYEETALPRWQYGKMRNVALLSTCRTIYKEAMPVFYSQTTLVLNSWQLLPFPTTIDRYMRGGRTRELLREVLIHDPLAMSYMYTPHSLPRKQRAKEWSIGLLTRHLPNLRTLTISDITPILIHVSCARSWIVRLSAAEQYIRQQLSQTLDLVNAKGIQRHAKLSVFASARLQARRIGCPNHNVDHQCEWPLAEPKPNEMGEVVITVQLHPWPDQCSITADDRRLACDMFMRASIRDPQFPVRNF